MKEEWKIIENTKNQYQISNLGRIRSKKSGEWTILKPHKGKRGYFEVKLHLEGEKNRKNRYIHRLVAQAFLEKIENKPEINHIDGNKLNNCVENLEYVNSSENTEHAIKNNLLIAWNKPRKPVIAINLQTKEQIRFESISKAEIFFNSRHITDVLKGRRNMVKGHTFKYEGGD